MLSHLFLASTLAAAALALPQQIPRQEPTYTTNTTYYQGLVTADSCGTQVATGSVTSGICITHYTYSLAVQPLVDRDCTYTLWKGTTDCGESEGSEGTPGGEETSLQAGGDAVCITTSVLDGGQWYHASGMLQCGGYVD